MSGKIFFSKQCAGGIQYIPKPISFICWAVWKCSKSSKCEALSEQRGLGRGGEPWLCPIRREWRLSERKKGRGGKILPYRLSPRLRFPPILMTALHQVLPLGLQRELSFPHTNPHDSISLEGVGGGG